MTTFATQVRLRWQNVGWWPESTPIYDAVKAAACEHGRPASMGCPICYPCCDYDRHRCHFCGDPLRHDGSPYDREPGEPNPCYQEVRDMTRPLVRTHADEVRQDRRPTRDEANSMIQLTGAYPNRNPIWVDPGAVVMVEAVNDVTTLTLAGGYQVEVDESVDAVVDLIGRHVGVMLVETKVDPDAWTGNR